MCLYRVGACVYVRVCVSLYGGCKCECVRVEGMEKRPDSHRLVEYLGQYPVIHSSVFSTSFKRTSSKNCCFYNPDFGNQDTKPERRRASQGLILNLQGPDMSTVLAPASGLHRGWLLPSHWRARYVQAGDGRWLREPRRPWVASWQPERAGESVALETDSCNGRQPQACVTQQSRGPVYRAGSLGVALSSTGRAISL